LGFIPPTLVIQEETIWQPVSAVLPEKQNLPAINNLTIQQFNNSAIQPFSHLAI
jgi:hypothetical protein